MPLRAIESLSLADQVFEQLVAEILAGRYAPATNLPSERKLVEIFGVNRHVVREALKRLEQIRLVKVSQGGGTKVVDFESSAGLDLLAIMAQHATVRDEAMGYWLAVHEMRAALAADAARLCAQRAAPDIKKDLVDIARRMSEAKEGPEVFTLELRFWDRVLQGAGNIAYRLAFNSLLQAVFAPAIVELARHWSLHEVKQSGYRVPIAAAIAAGDAALAEARTRESLRGVVSVLEGQVRAPAKGSAPVGVATAAKARKVAGKGRGRPRG